MMDMCDRIEIATIQSISFDFVESAVYTWVRIKSINSELEAILLQRSQGQRITPLRRIAPIMKTQLEFSSDILQPIALKEWPLLQEILKAEWPKYAFYYYWIANSTKWKKQRLDLAIEIYSPHGRYQDDTTFVGISTFSWWMVIVFTKDPSGKRLHEALITTRRLDWSKEVTFTAVHQYIQPILFSALATLQRNQGIGIDFDISSCFQIKSADECANVEVEVPEECYLGDLNESHLPVIHSVWPHVYKEEPENSLKLLQLSVTVNRSLGLFLKEGNVLVSWALHNDWHGLGAVQTLDAYKRRGYARVVVNALAKQLGKEGISPVLCVRLGNTLSEKMFASLNWKRTIPATWVTMKKHPPSVN